MMAVSRRGTPRRRAIVVAASGSVGETMAPSANAAAHGRPSTAACRTTSSVCSIGREDAIRGNQGRRSERADGRALGQCAA